MAVVTIPERSETVRDLATIASFLAVHGIIYEQWTSDRRAAVDASADEILRLYADKLDELKARGGYASADVIDVTAATPGLETMLARFSREHLHDEDEVRFVVEGRGVFHIHPAQGPIFAIEVEAGDLISVPRGTLHWFDLCAERRIRAIRLFQDTAGWTPHYTDSGVDAGFQPMCLGLSYLPGATARIA